MDCDRLAMAIAESLARHQSRGLVDGAGGMADVVIHGRVDLLAVAEDVLAAAAAERKQPPRKSWAGWFVRQADVRQGLRRREKLTDRAGNGSDPAGAAIARLRLRELDC